MQMPEHKITALIGPSGCGKSTLLRCMNRMNDLVAGSAAKDRCCTAGRTCTRSDVDAVEVRRRIGMVFQKPNPFPKSIYENIAFGPKVNGIKGNMDEIVERSLRAGSALGRGEGQARARAGSRSPAGSSSGCASRARWRCSRTSS